MKVVSLARIVWVTTRTRALRASEASEGIKLITAWEKSLKGTTIPGVRSKSGGQGEIRTHVCVLGERNEHCLELWDERGKLGDDVLRATEGKGG